MYIFKYTYLIYLFQILIQRIVSQEVTKISLSRELRKNQRSGKDLELIGNLMMTIAERHPNYVIHAVVQILIYSVE